MTVFDQIKNLTIEEMATLIAQMVDHEMDPCNCPIGVFHRGCQNEGYCRFAEKSCDESALEWLRSEDQLYIDVPCYLRENQHDDIRNNPDNSKHHRCHHLAQS